MSSKVQSASQNAQLFDQQYVFELIDNTRFFARRQEREKKKWTLPLLMGVLVLVQLVHIWAKSLEITRISEEGSGVKNSLE